MIGYKIFGQMKMHDLLYELGANADKAVSIALFRCAQHAEGEIKRTLQKTFKPGTGNLMRSFTAQMLSKKGSTLTAGAVSDLVYAEIQNDGGTIRSSRGPSKFLAYPVVDMPVGQWASDTPDLHVGIAPYPSKLGLVLMDSSNRVIFNLAKKVTIKPTKYLEKAQESSSKEWSRIFNERLAELADAAAQKAGG